MVHRNGLLRSARKAADLSQERLADLVNAEIGRASNHPGSLDGSTVSRLERGVITRPAQRTVDALCAVLRATEEELGFERAQVNPEPIRWSIQKSRPTSDSLDALSQLLTQTRRLEDTVSAAAVLPAVAHYTGIVTGLAKDANLAVRPAALDLVNEFTLYRGWLRFAVGDSAGARADFNTGMVAAVEGDSSTGVADSLSFKGYVDLHEGDPLSAASLAAAANRYEQVPINRVYFHLLTARCLAIAGNITDSDRQMSEADRVQVTDPQLTGRNYWYTPGWLTVQRGLVHATAGRPKTAIREISDGLAGMPKEQRNAEWVQKYEAIRDALENA